MPGKFFFLAGLFALAIQVRGNAQPENLDQGLDQVKQMAIEVIQKYRSQAEGHASTYLRELPEHRRNVMEAEVSRVEELIEENMEKLKQAAGEYYEKGKQESKPIQYYYCVAWVASFGALMIRKHQKSYDLQLADAQQAPLMKVDATTIATENMISNFYVLMREYIEEIKACRNGDCIEKGVSRAWNAFKLSRRVMTSFMTQFMKEYQIFLRKAFEVTQEFVSVMEDDVSRALEGMSRC